MKTIETTLIIISVMAAVACRQQPPDKRTQMVLDSEVSGKNVTVVRPKETVRPAEPMPDLKELSTIMQCDLDATQRTPTKEVAYVKRGEPVRPSEKRQ